MNKPSKWVAGLVLAVAALGAALPAFAHGRHRHGRVHFGIGLHLGPHWSPFWGPAWYYPPPYYYAPVVVAPPAAPPVYVERGDAQAQSQGYWYYCEQSRGYYPYVKECPGGWKAVPPAPPPAQ
ncbi:MAG TPA: hypothetical protein VF211_01885 [Burkholderiales bacterium]